MSEDSSSASVPESLDTLYKFDISGFIWDPSDKFVSFLQIRRPLTQTPTNLDQFGEEERVIIQTLQWKSDVVNQRPARVTQLYTPIL